jgi:hypothetical protein
METFSAKNVPTKRKSKLCEIRGFHRDEDSDRGFLILRNIGMLPHHIPEDHDLNNAT